MSGRSRQAGFTLVELIVTLTLGVVVMGALASVIWVTAGATATWDPRLQASGEARTFQLAFYDDAVQADITQGNVAACIKGAGACNKAPMELVGTQYSSSGGGSTSLRTVTYCLTSGASASSPGTIKRTVAAGTQADCDSASPTNTWTPVSRFVTSWNWYYDTGLTSGLCPSPGAIPSPPALPNTRGGCIVVAFSLHVQGVGGQAFDESETVLGFPRLDPQTTVPAP